MNARIDRSRRWALGWTGVVLGGLLLAQTVQAAAPAKSAAALHALAARPAPDWLTRGVIYQIWLRGFTPEGTLAAATERLPQVAELGANIIYLCPVCLQDDDMRIEFWSTRQKASGTNNPRNPYRIKDYNRVDPEYGTEADLRAFVQRAHDLGLKVLMDLVYFHCGPTSDLMAHPEYFKKDKAGKISTGSWNFPVLDFNNRQLREYLWANMVHWVRDFGVDGYRCDVADMVPLDFWEEARDRLTPLRPDVVILAEGQRKDDQVKAFDIDYGFSWYNTTRAIFQKSQPASALRKIWEQQAAERPQGARFMRYTENHDLVNDLLRVDVICSEGGARAMAVINFTIDGVPLLYNGQEFGDTSLQSIYARWPVCWAAACLPKSKQKLAFSKALCQLRREALPLSAGQTVWLDNDQPDAVVSFLRQHESQQIVTVVNLSNRVLNVKVDLPAGAAASAWQPLLDSPAKPQAGQPGVTLKFDGFGYFVGRR